MDDFYKEVDLIATRQNAYDVLRQYRKFARIAGSSKIDIRSPRMSDMPKSPNYNNRTEDAIIQHTFAESECREIVKALNLLSIASAQILRYTFCEVDRMSNWEIAKSTGYSERQLSRKKQQALEEFAEAYRYPKLIAYTGKWNGGEMS